MWLPLQSQTYLSLKCTSFPTSTLTCMISVSRSMEGVHPVHTTPNIRPLLALDDQPSTSTLKRPPSPSFEAVDGEITRKRFKEDPSEQIPQLPIASTSKYNAFVEDLAQELQCGCCAELVYRPVVVSPCQHFFCGRYSWLMYARCNQILTRLQLLCTLDQGELLSNCWHPVPRDGPDLHYHALVWFRQMCGCVVFTFSGRYFGATQALTRSIYRTVAPTVLPVEGSRVMSRHLALFRQSSMCCYVRNPRGHVRNGSECRQTKSIKLAHRCGCVW